MLNFNSLYNAVFNPTYPEFDSEKDYYNIIIDTPEFKPLFHEVSSKLNTLMNRDAFTYYHSENKSDLSQDCIEEQISSITEMLDSKIQGVLPARRFCILTYFDDNSRDIDFVINTITNLRREPKDIVTLIVCMSKQMQDKCNFLTEFANQLVNKAPYVDWYFFSDLNTTYYRRMLTYSICGTIINGANILLQKQRKNRKISADNNTMNYVDSQLGEGGKAYVASLPPISWSTVCYKYYDRQHDFLSKYILDTCNNLRKITPQYFGDLLDSIYRNNIPKIEAGTVREILNRSISMMPFVIPSVHKNSINRLYDYFNIAYGVNGPFVVELTFKATLTGIYNYSITDTVVECTKQIFINCSKFAEDGIYDIVCNMLEQRISNLQSTIKAINSSINLILDEDITYGSHSDTLDKYIDKYNQLYVNQKEEAFWVEVLRIIKSHPKDYSQYCEMASNYHKEIMDLIKSFPSVNSFDNVKMDVVELTAADILTLDQNTEICKYIQKQYEFINQERFRKNSPQDCSAVLDIEFDPHFYSYFEVNYSNEAYELCGIEANGKYLAYIGGEKDV